MKTHKVRRGYNLPIVGAPTEETADAPRPSTFAVRPTEFRALKPRLHVKVGDTVKIGTTLFVDKARPEIRFASPAAGRVHDIQYGHRRAIERISIQSSSDDFVQFENFRPGEISKVSRERLVEHLLEGGVWPFLRRRPFDIVARPDDEPTSIFVNCMDTAPLAANPEFALKGKFPEFEAGIEAMRVLCSRVHVVVSGDVQKSIFSDAKGVELHRFSGRHPAGLVSTHIERIDPITAPTRCVWYINARDLVQIGSYLLVGQYPTERVVALAGPGIKHRRYLHARAGASVESLVAADLEAGEQRIVSGNVLTGKKVQKEESLGFYDDLITVIPEGREQHFIGWMLPGFFRPTWSRAFASALLPIKEFSMHTNRNGEGRALVKTGDYRRVISLDVLPEQLVKAILAEDIELMEQLGILECAPEDFALCSYICPSKTEFTEIIQKGLDMMRAELT